MANPYLDNMEDEDVVEIPMKSTAKKANPYLDNLEDTPEPKVRFQSQPPERSTPPTILDNVPILNLIPKAANALVKYGPVKNKREVVTMDGPKGQEQIMDLPTPSKDMYKGLSQDDMNALYEAYQRHPKTVDGTYKNQPVPLPLEDNSSGVFGGVYEGTRNMASLGSAVAEDQGLLPEGTTGKLNDALPAYEPTKPGQKVGSLVGQVFSAGGVEGAIFRSGVKVASVLPKVGSAVTAIAKTVGHIMATTGAGAATFSNPTKKTEEGFATSNDNWFAGNEDALAANLPGKVGKFFSGLDGKSESEAQSIIEDRINIALDTAAVAAPVEMLANFGKKLGLLAYNMFAENFHGAVSKDVNRKVAFREFMDGVYDIAEAQTPEEKQFLSKKLVTFLEDPKNSQIILDTGVEGVEKGKVDLNTLQTMRNALAGDDSEMAKRLLQKFEDQQSNIINKGIGDKTRAAAERPAEALKKITAQTEEVFNPVGQNTPEATAGAIQREGQERIGRAIADTETAIAQSDQLNKTVPYEIAGKIDEGNKIIRDTSNANYAKIPEGQAFMSPEYETRVQEIGKKYGKQLPIELQQAMIDAQSDFAKVIKLVRPSLSREITTLEKAANSSGQRPAQLNALIELKKYITQIEPDNMEKFVRIKGNKRQEVVDAFRIAEDYYKNTVVKYVKDGIPQEVSQINKKPIEKFGPSKKNALKAGKINTGLKEPKMSEHLTETLSTEPYGKSEGLVTKMTDAEKAAENAKFARTQVEEDTYKLMDDFFTREGALKGKGGDTGTSFKDVFTGKFNKDKIQRLGQIVESKGDEKVKAGWRAAYMKVFMDEVLPEAGVNIPSNPELLEVGKLVFKDQPEVMDTLSQLMDPAVRNTRDARARPKGSTIGDALAGAKQDVGSFTKTVYGPLSRPGTILNTWMGRLLDVADPKSVRAHFRDSIMADPKVFAQALKDYQSAKEPSRKIRIAFNYLVRAGIVNEEDWDDYSSSQLNDGDKKRQPLEITVTPKK